MYNNQYMNPYTNQYRPNNNQTNITWVQGIESAKAYQLPSNSSALLMDNENDGVFYIKVSDNIGMCTLRTFRYEEIVDTVPAQIDTSNYITKEEFYAEIEKLRGGLIDGQKTEPAVYAAEPRPAKRPKTKISEQNTANGYDVQRNEKSGNYGPTNG